MVLIQKIKINKVLNVTALYARSFTLKSCKDEIINVPTKKQRKSFPLSRMRILKGILFGIWLGIISVSEVKSSNYLMFASILS